MDNQAQLILEFWHQHKGQIERTAYKFGVPADDVKQEIALFILGRSSEYEEDQAGFASFVFGHVKTYLKSQTKGAMKFAISIDDEDVRIQIEAIEQDIEVDYFNVPNELETVPGTAGLLSLAAAIGTQSAVEIGLKLGKTKRRINQILAAARSQAVYQYSLF